MRKRKKQLSPFYRDPQPGNRQIDATLAKAKPRVQAKMSSIVVHAFNNPNAAEVQCANMIQQ